MSYGIPELDHASSRHSAAVSARVKTRRLWTRLTTAPAVVETMHDTTAHVSEWSVTDGFSVCLRGLVATPARNSSRSLKTPFERRIANVGARSALGDGPVDSDADPTAARRFVAEHKRIGAGLSLAF